MKNNDIKKIKNPKLTKKTVMLIIGVILILYEMYLLFPYGVPILINGFNDAVPNQFGLISIIAGISYLFVYFLISIIGIILVICALKPKKKDKNNED